MRNMKASSGLKIMAHMTKVKVFCAQARKIQHQRRPLGSIYDNCFSDIRPGNVIKKYFY